MNVRDIIKEATIRVNIVPRRQAIPGDILETGYRLLKGIVNKYNYDNLLNWTQNSIILNKATLIHIYDNTDVVAGKNNLYFESTNQLHAYVPDEEEYNNNTWAMVKGEPDAIWVVYSPAPGVYDWHYQAIYDHSLQRIQEMELYMAMKHMQIRDVAKINSLYVVSNTNEPYKEFYKLDYVNHTEFDKYANNARVFTYTQKSEGEWVIQIKPYGSANYQRLKLNYNQAIDFDIDSDLYIPDNYIELLIVALAHKLALQYPRLDEAQMNRLEKEVQVLIDNVRTPKASDRILFRSDYFLEDYQMSQSDLMSGRFFY